MEHEPAQSTAVPNPGPTQPSGWLQTVSGVAVLTVGLQGTAASAVDAPVIEAGPDAAVETAAVEIANDVAYPISSPIEPAAPQPRFSQWRRQVQKLTTRDIPSSAVSQISPSVVRLENHRRELHRRSNEVESQLLGLQQLLSIQSYGTSFADRLLDENDAYQTKLQALTALEADMHAAIEQADMVALSQLQARLQRSDQELRQIAQQQLQHYIQQVQDSSTMGLWREPMYQQSLRWLMEHTHERHLLNARQQTLARTLVAIAPD
ncbi:hypothetical protein IQ260_26980 [Leptolyngbya cf. ectocarpi LEGE 11479]|uniref:Uncharacterized protein n=1 Tax=Leptolyngbya cf. ectocarpi LEGE 11479 TaxID=1828722 RepID=A0A928ZZI4_LEPEC|nr:hypothetical protein [Leptolyngbya ectocarpi]MBE9070291.1 hypothetical protein [Leptolyngbya cf. ectocarpi LEGE 11479]